MDKPLNPIDLSRGTGITEDEAEDVLLYLVKEGWLLSKHVVFNLRSQGELDLPDDEEEIIELNSHIDSGMVLRGVLEGGKIKRKFKTEGGNGDTVDVSLELTDSRPEDVRELLMSNSIQTMLESVGLEIVDTDTRQ